MPSGNQGRPQDPGRQNGGAGKGARESLQNVGQRVQEGAQQVGQRVQEGAQQVGQRVSEGIDTAREEVGRRYRGTEGMMARNPRPSVLIGFGIGFGLGLVVTTMLGERETWAERNVPDQLRNLPGSLHDTLEQLADSVRSLPEALKRHIPSTLTRR